jgi:hypothetical protein
MDEVGRGTTVEDGLAISFATLHHLASVNKSRCLFATHFHELADMVGSDNGNGQGLFHTVRFYCSDINKTEVILCSSKRRIFWLMLRYRTVTSHILINCVPVSIAIVTVSRSHN